MRVAPLILTAALSLAQSERPSHPYLFRIEHVTFTDGACALLHADGTFHLEFGDRERTKVFEGAISNTDLAHLKAVFEDQQLSSLTQRQIEEPILPSKLDLLELTIYRNDRVQDIVFKTSESRQPVKRLTGALIDWLDKLHKLPHKEFSEDEGAQHCLPATPIALRKRSPPPLPGEHAVPPDVSSIKASVDTTPAIIARQDAPQPVVPLLRLSSVSVKSDSARQYCVLIGENGEFRFENRTQKSGKQIDTSLSVGRLGPAQMTDLFNILQKPELSKIRHHEPRTTVVRVMGDMLKLSIARPQGAQTIIFSSAFGRQFGTTYGGDADLRPAHELLEFLKDHIENNRSAMLDKSARNDCTEIP